MDFFFYSSKYQFHFPQTSWHTFLCIPKHSNILGFYHSSHNPFQDHSWHSAQCPGAQGLHWALWARHSQYLKSHRIRDSVQLYHAAYPVKQPRAHMWLQLDNTPCVHLISIAFTQYLKLGNTWRKEVYLAHDFGGSGAWCQHLCCNEGPMVMASQWQEHRQEKITQWDLSEARGWGGPAWLSCNNLSWHSSRSRENYPKHCPGHSSQWPANPPLGSTSESTPHLSA